MNEITEDLKKLIKEKKEEIKQKNKDKKMDKELLKQKLKEDEEFEKWYKEEYKDDPDNKFNFEDFLDLLLNIDGEEDDGFIDQEYLDQINKMNRENKAILISAGSIVGIAAVIFIVCLVVFNRAIKSDYETIYMPMMKQYVDAKYGDDYELEIPSQICEETGDYNNRKEVCLNYLLSKTSNNNYIIMGIDKDGNATGEYGDNVSNDIEEDYKLSLKNKLGITIVNNNSQFSYKDYYISYNYYKEEINILPNNYSFDKLYNSNKLTIVDTIIFTGNLDLNKFKNYVSKLTSESSIYLIQTVNGIPKNLYVSNNKKVEKHTITTQLKLDDEVSNYQIDTTNNNINRVKRSKISSYDFDYITDDDERTYAIENPYYYEFDEVSRTYNYSNKKEEKIENYYSILYMKNINYNNRYSYILFENSNNSAREINLENEDIIMHTVYNGTGSFIINNYENGLGIGSRVARQECSFIDKIKGKCDE